MPSNIDLLPVLGLWYPDVPIIFCTRDLLDVGITIYFRYYSSGNKPYFDLAEIGRYIARYTMLCKFMEAVLPNPVCWVRYEDLVEDPAAEIRRLAAFLDLDPTSLGDACAVSANEAYRHPVDSHELPTPITTDAVGIHQRFGHRLDPLWHGIMRNLGD